MGIQEVSQASWRDRGIKYLGIKFASQLDHMIQDNVRELVWKLNNWVMLPLSWLGRIAVVKMNVLPLLLFYFLGSNSPKEDNYEYPISYYKIYLKIKTLENKSWNIAAKGTEGGLGLSNILKYYQAAQLTTLLDWY